MSSAIKSLILTAQKHGVELNFDRVMHESSLKENQEPDARGLCRIADRNKLITKQISASWHDLRDMGTAYPVIAQLKNKQYVVILGFNKDDRDETITVADPSSSTDKLLKIHKDKFNKAWSSRLILVKTQSVLSDEEPPFSINWVANECRSEKGLLLKTCSIAFMLHLVAAIPILYIMLVLDKVLPFESQSSLIVLSAAVGASVLISGILAYLKQTIRTFYSSKLETKIHLKQFDVLMSKPLGFYQSRDKNELSKLTQSATSLKTLFADKVYNAIFDGIALLIFTPILLILSPTLFVTVLIFALLMMLVQMLSLSTQQQLLSQSERASSEKDRSIHQIISNIESIKSMALEPTFKNEWEENTSNYNISQQSLERKKASYAQVINVLKQLSGVTLIFIGTLMVLNNSLSIGVLIGTYLLAHKIINPFLELSSLRYHFRSAGILAHKLSSAFASETDSETGRISPKIYGNIELRGLNFSYADDQHVFKKLNLKIAANQTVAIVGPTGSGCSSILKLIKGLLIPNKGSVFIDDYELSTINPDHLSANIGLVDPTHTLFPGTIRSNITRSYSGISREQLHRVLRLSGLVDELANLPKGLDTPIKQDGGNFSQGMRFKIDLARALIREPKILLIDKSLIQLATDEELSFVKNMPLISRGRTVIITTHRISETANYGDIVVLTKHGNILEHGSYEQLIDKNGWYAQRIQQETDQRRSMFSSKTESKDKDLTKHQGATEILSRSSSQASTTTCKTTAATTSITTSSSSKADEDSNLNSDLSVSEKDVSNHSMNDNITDTAPVTDSNDEDLDPSSASSTTDISDAEQALRITQKLRQGSPLKGKTHISATDVEASIRRGSELSQDPEGEEIQVNDTDNAAKIKQQDHEKSQSLNSLKLKELGERLHRNNLQAQEARQRADKKLEEVKKTNEHVSTPNTMSNEPSEESNSLESTESTKVTAQEKTLTSFIEGYLKND